jgi:transposase
MTDHYLSKLSIAEIQDIVQCGPATIYRLKKLWDKTGDVERICRRAGRPRKMEDILEQAVVQIMP